MNNVSIEWQRCFYHPLITNHHSDIRLKMVKMWFKSQNNPRHATFNLKPISEDSLVLAQGNQGLAILFIRVIERSRRRDNRPPKINAFPLIRFSSLNRFCFYPGSFNRLVPSQKRSEYFSRRNLDFLDFRVHWHQLDSSNMTTVAHSCIKLMNKMSCVELERVWAFNKGGLK